MAHTCEWGVICDGLMTTPSPGSQSPVCRRSGDARTGILWIACASEGLPAAFGAWWGRWRDGSGGEVGGGVRGMEEGGREG